MTEQDIYKLLADGERVTLECKKAQNGVQILCGKHILHLLIRMVEFFCWGYMKT